jgi:tetratricopeptide (TPR) repeat protein
MKRISLTLFPLLSVLALGLLCRAATIREEKQVIRTYPFSGPDPVPVRADGGQRQKIYPYFSFDDLAYNGVDQTWNVIHLENPYIEAFVLPATGGKLIGAIEKSTQKDFIYYNHVLKFRSVALRGPWTSGGIEANFGLIGHAPSTATPVDYLIRKNPDGSVSCIVGNVDLPSRTQWRVEYIVPPDKAYVEVHSFWYNPQPLNQSYYVWMNAAQKLTNDLEFVLPGVGWMGDDYSVPSEPWPLSKDGRNLALYRNHNDNDANSFFVFGAFEDFRGGYWHDSQFGYGHWALHEDVPGQKLWLWPVSRAGAIWHDLLTDNDGPYFEPQTGRLLDQSDHEFLASDSADHWRELYFPYKKIGPMVKATPYGVLNVSKNRDTLVVSFCALQSIVEDLTISAQGKQLAHDRIILKPMEVYQRTFAVSIPEGHLRVDVGDKLSYTDDPDADLLKRPLHFHNFDESSVEGLYQSAERDDKRRNYNSALRKYQSVVQREPLHVRALTRLAELFCRRAEYEQALQYARRALDVAMYDPDANYIYGIIATRLDDLVDAKETLGWAARSMKYRSAAYSELGGIYLMERNFDLALEFLDRSLTYDAYNIRAYQLLATARRLNGQPDKAGETLSKILDIDPLNHFARFEQYLLDPRAGTLNNFQSMIRNEFPYETYLEIAAYYANLRLDDDALQVLDIAPDQATVRYWQAFLLRKKSPERSHEMLEHAAALSPYLVFPFREESVPVFQWAATAQPDDWKPKYYLGLIYWGMQRNEDALKMFSKCDDQPNYAPAYISRAFLEKETNSQRARADFEKAYSIDKKDWRTWYHLTNYYLGAGMDGRALQLAAAASQQFPKEDALRILLARAYLNSGKYEDSYNVLANASILPREGQSDVHQLWVESLVSQALADMKKSRYQEAVARLESSREFPERLGTGKPDDPDYRIQDHLEIFCYEKLGMTAKAEEARVRIKAWASRHPGSTAEVETRRVEEWYRSTLPAEPELEALQALAGLIQNAPEKGHE